MVAPKVLSASATNATSVLITFDQNMDPLSAGLASNYTIPGRTIQGVGTGGALVVLTVFPKWKTGDPYTLHVGSSVKNVLAEFMDPSFKSANFVGFPSAPQLDLPGCVATNSRRVRVSFNVAMRKDIELSDPGNYVLAPAGPGLALVNVNDVIVPNAATPDYVDLDLTEMTNGGAYTLTVSGLYDYVGNVMTGPANAPIVGIGVRPTIASIAAVSVNRVDVKFSELMEDNADLRNPAKYVFNNGLVVLEVLSVDGDTVRLATSDQSPDVVYNLVVFP